MTEINQILNEAYDEFVKATRAGKDTITLTMLILYQGFEKYQIGLYKDIKFKIEYNAYLSTDEVVPINKFYAPCLLNKLEDGILLDSPTNDLVFFATSPTNALKILEYYINSDFSFIKDFEAKRTELQKEIKKLQKQENNTKLKIRVLENLKEEKQNILELCNYYLASESKNEEENNFETKEENSSVLTADSLFEITSSISPNKTSEVSEEGKQWLLKLTKERINEKLKKAASQGFYQTIISTEIFKKLIVSGEIFDKTLISKVINFYKNNGFEIKVLTDPNSQEESLVFNWDKDRNESFKENVGADFVEIDWA